jgi:hypothetical protein
MNAFLTVFAKGLTDENDKVRRATIKAISSMTLSLGSEQHVASFLNLLPGVLKLMSEYIRLEEDDIVSECFEIFEELLVMNSEAFTKQIPNLIKIMIDIASNVKVSQSIRVQGMEIISWCVEHAPKVISTTGSIEPILKVVFQLLCEPEEDQEEEETPHKVASSLLDTIANSLASDYIFKPIITYALKLCKSDKAHERKAGITTIGIMAEGCHEHMKDHLSNFLPILIEALRDNNRQVREVGLLAIHAFVEYLQPEIMEHYQKIIPICIEMLADPSDNIKEKCVFTLDALCQNLQELILPYLEKIMSVAYGLLTTNNPSFRVQEIAVSAISTCASASGIAFLPYSQKVLKMMAQIMSSKHPDLLSLRARATECAGNIAFAIGAKNFPCKEFISFAIDGLNINSPDLREYAYGFFSNMAHVLGSDFADLLPHVMKHLIDSVNATDYAYNKESGESLVAGVLGNDDVESDTDTEELENSKFTVYSAIVDEKAAAISTIGVIAEVCKEKFEPYLQTCYSAISLNLTHFHFDVKREVVGTLKLLMSKNDVTELIDTYATLMTEEEDKECVARMCETVSFVCKRFGPVLTKNTITKVTDALLDLLQHKGECNENEIYGKDHDMVLIDSVSDCIDELAKAYGPQFEPFYRNIYKTLFTYAKDAKSEGDVMMSVGTIGNVCGYLRHASIPYIETMLPLMIQCMKSPSSKIKRNAIFTLGLMCVSCPDQMKDYTLQILQMIAPLFKDPKKYDSMYVDNACATVARIITTFETSLTILDQVLNGLLDALPLRDDFNENPTIYGCILSLLKRGNNSAAKSMGKILNLFANILGSEDLQPEIQQSIIEAIRDLSQKYPQQFDNIMKEIKQKDNLFKHLKY